MNKPVIGITLDHETDEKYSIFPYYALRENYISSVTKHGGTPILLPFDNQSLEKYIDIINGLIITGGNFDISPTLYGNNNIHAETSLKKERTKFEWNICKKSIEKQIPILGICGGMQLLNVILGGDLIQHIPEEIQNPLNHEAKPYNATAHKINIIKNTKLYQYAEQQLETQVNSSHHQATGKIGKDMIASAQSSDTVIEAIEHINYPFMVGVQWHPEYQLTALDKNLFKNLIIQCQN